MVRSSAMEYRDAFKFLRLLMISSQTARDLKRTNIVDSTFDVVEWDTLLPALVKLVDAGFVVDFRTMCAASMSSRSIFCDK